MLRTVIALAFAAGFQVGDTRPPPPPKNLLVWRADDVVEKGGDKTFIAFGTRKGGHYVFRARRECTQQAVAVYTGYGVVWRRHSSDIFGIDFRITFGQGEKLIMNVGNRKPEQTELAFTATEDNVQIRIRDNWELPRTVSCLVDDIQVLTQ
jgi:hypothetical protein